MINEAANPQSVFELSKAALRRNSVSEAIRFADRLVQITDGASNSIEWAVQVRIHAKQWESAIEVGRSGLAKVPTANLYALLGHAHEALGQDGLAESAFQQASLDDPNNAPWLYHRAAALLRMYRDFEAMELLRSAAAILPNAVCLIRLAELELAMGSPEAALVAADKALELDPTSPLAQTLAARSLMMQGRTQEAAARWERAATLGESESTQIELLRARDLLRHGEFEGGIDLLGQIIDNQPSRAPAYILLAESKRVTDDDRPRVRRMESLLENAAGEDTAGLEYAIGKSYDDLTDYETAIKHFDEANRIKYVSIKAHGGFNQEGYAANIDIRKDVFNYEVLDLFREEGNLSEIPIFVIGMVRSGTTLAEQILSSHPVVRGAGELRHWINSDLRLIDYPNRLLDIKILREVADQYSRLVSGLARGAQRVVDKQPGNLLLAGALNIAFPNARIICMKRDSLDTAISIWTTHIRTTTTFVHDKANIVFASRQHERLINHWREVIPADRFLEVSYESLITDREQATRQMLGFCGLEWSEDCLFPERNRKLVTTPSAWQVRQPVYRSSIGRWKNYEPWLGEFREFLRPGSEK